MAYVRRSSSLEDERSSREELAFMKYVHTIAVAAACVLAASFEVQAATAPSPSPTPAGPFASLDFRTIGPDYGRIDAVAGVPGNPKVYFAGGLGGLLRSSDGGATWQEIFSDKPVSSIGAIAVAPSNPKIVYIGTGEPNLRSDIAFGDGVWRSDDGGDTWKHAGLDGTGQIAAVTVDPADPNIVFVAAVGDPYRAGPERGVYKTSDGGATWRRVLSAGDEVGASSVVMQPGDPHTLFAGLWRASRSPYMLTSGGAGGGLFESTDDGEHWTRLAGHGLPDGDTGRIGFAFAPNTPARLYALIEAKRGVLWRSDDAGATWQAISDNHALDQRPFYFTQLSVDPRDKNHVYFLSVNFMESKDGGATAKRRRVPGGDNHQMWIDPTDGDRLIVGDDGGIMYSLTGGKTWAAPYIMVAQPYHLALDDRLPYTVCSEDQDSGAACGPSYDLINGDIEPVDWFAPGGGESGWIVFDRTDDNIIYGSGYEGGLTRYDRRTNQVANISPWPEDTSGWGAADLKYRFQWTAPLATASWNPKALFFGGNRLFVTYDRGRNWAAISPDLTRNEKSWQRHSGGPITGDNTGPEYYDTIFTVATSPVRAGQIWVGTDDGLAWLTTDLGAHWKQVTPQNVGMPQFGRVNYIDPSPFDPAVAYMAVEDHERGSRAPYLYATSNFGRTWRSIASNLPDASYARMIKEDPVRRGLLYAGTETGLWFSFDDGGVWQQLHDNFPTVPVYDFMVQPRFDDLVVSTHGRSNLIFDDLRPLQEYGPVIAARAVYLFTMRPVYRLSSVGQAFLTTPGSGDNPEYGADVNFYLQRMPSKKAKVKLTVLNGATAIRTMDLTDLHSGVNRAWWDLHYDGITKVKDAAVEGTGGFDGPLAMPGRYTIRLSAAGAVMSRTVDILPDPRAKVPMADLRSQLSFLLRIRDDLARIGARINKLRDARTQADKAKASAMTSHASDAAIAVATFERSVDEALSGLYQPADLAGEDDIRDPIHVYEKLNSLAGFVNSADVAPRPADIDALNVLEGQMRSGMTRADGVLSDGVASLDAILTKDGLSVVKVK
jgi:photosystem II stability/assembly factor-like uncharacterized protein